jgi:nucleoside-diphosphate-sugar epimerase
MAGSDVFLTGATGYIGPAVLSELSRSGRTVTALVREPTPLTGAQTVVGQLGFLDGLAGEIGASGSIVHLASERSAERERVVYEDIMGTGELLDAWQRGPFVYASSATIHGEPRAVLEASAPIDILDWYNAGKAVNEFQVRDAVEAAVPGRGPGISLRPCLYFGRSHRAPFRQYLNSYFFHAQAGHTFTCDTDAAGAGAGVSYIGDADYGRAVVAALDRGTSAAYPIASGFVTYRDLLDTINRVAGTTGRWAVRPPSGPDDFRVPHSRIEINSSAFTAQTGWHPQQGLDELVSAFVAGEREAGRAESVGAPS